MLNDTNKIIEILAENGFESYFVGGCVRDMIMKRAMTDIDITTTARPDDIMRIFPQENIFAVPTGLEHGTITVVYKGLNVEVTTFRKDVSTDGRRSTVEFGTSLEEDLLRRDFTMNAIAYRLKDDAFIDPFGGRADIRRQTIRAVGVPIDRFREDYLRMFRAHRFEAVLEFAIEGATWEALVSAASEEWCEVISVERIREEINKSFKAADKPSIMFEGLRTSDLLQNILPELLQCYGFEQNRYHEYDLYYHTLHIVDGVPKERYLVRWAALLHDLGKVTACKNYGPDSTFHSHERDSLEIARNIMGRFKFGNVDAGTVLNLVKHHMRNYSDSMKDSSVRKLVGAVGINNIEALCILWSADKTAKSRIKAPLSIIDASAILKRLEKMGAEEKVFGIKDLQINGREVMDIKKISSSPEVGEILRKLYDIVVEDTSLNTKEELRDIVAKM